LTIRRQCRLSTSDHQFRYAADTPQIYVDINRDKSLNKRAPNLGPRLGRDTRAVAHPDAYTEWNACFSPHQIAVLQPRIKWQTTHKLYKNRASD
jgi:hypothetical protein